MTCLLSTPAGNLRPGESPLEAAARRYHERKDRDVAEGKITASKFPTQARAYHPPKMTRCMGSQKKKLDSSTFDIAYQSRHSFSGRWYRFKRQYLPW